jgi:hypothetical protein
MAISIPITLAMTFGMMYLLGIDIQQVSVATLIIAVGLLVMIPSWRATRSSAGSPKATPAS